VSDIPEPPAVAGERWLTPGVRGIGAASLLADIGHEVPTSLLPSLLTSTLGAPAAALGTEQIERFDRARLHFAVSA